MENREWMYLNCNQKLRDSINVFKEAFVMFYGENLRKEIEKAFNSALFIGYQTPSQLDSTLINMVKNKSKILIEYIMKNNKTVLSNDDLFKVNDFQYSYNFKYYHTFLIYKYKKFFEKYQLGKKGRINKFLKEGYNLLKKNLENLTWEEYINIVKTKNIPEKYQNISVYLKNNLEYSIDLTNCDKEYINNFKDIEQFLKKVDININEYNFEELLKKDDFKDLYKLTCLFEICKKDFDTYISKFSKYFQKNKLYGEIKNNLYYKYYTQLIKDNIDLIPFDKRGGLEDFFTDSSNSNKVDTYVKFIFGSNLKGFDGIECFSIEKEKEILMGEQFSWSIQETKKKRIEYFKNNGIDLGDNYDDYLENDDIKKIWPSKERVEKFLKSKKTLINEFNIELFYSLSDNIEIKKDIDSLGLLDKNDWFDARLYELETTCVNPNLIIKNKQIQLKPLVLINFDFNSNHTDHDIVHELNHLFELYLKSVKSNSYNIFTGWYENTYNLNQERKEKINTTTIEYPKIKYEIFNEIINEMISQEICEIMHNNNMYVFDDPNNSKYKNITSHDYVSNLARDFYNIFKDEIIESRRNGNIEKIFNTVGKQNFDEINNLFDIFYDNFSRFKYYNVLDSISKNEENEQTKIYFDLIRRKNEIMKKMYLYKEKSMREKRSI